MVSNSTPQRPSESKRTYRAPNIVDYGPVALLTLGSSPKKSFDGSANMIKLP